MLQHIATLPAEERDTAIAKLVAEMIANGLSNAELSDLEDMIEQMNAGNSSTGGN